MRPRLADGSWKSPFSPREPPRERSDYTDGNAWQYTWSVMHDVRGLMTLMGGPEAFVHKLDELFEQASVVEGDTVPADLAARIGQYAHGKAHSHHVAYLYAYAGAPWKSATRVNRIASSLYGTGPEGLCGNEACGQLSAWYLFSAMGFYPVNPADGVYVIGAPQVDKAAIDLGGQRTFTIEAQDLSPTTPLRDGRHAERQAARPLLDQPRGDRRRRHAALHDGRRAQRGVGLLARGRPAVDDEVNGTPFDSPDRRLAQSRRDSGFGARKSVEPRVFRPGGR